MDLPEECRTSMEFGMKMINLIGENNLYDVVGSMFDVFYPSEVGTEEFESMMAFIIHNEIASNEKVEILEEERKLVEEELEEIGGDVDVVDGFDELEEEK